jgi:hypothetical protein
MVSVLKMLRQKVDIVLPMMILVLSIVELGSAYILAYRQGLTNWFLPVFLAPCCFLEPLKIAILIFVVARIAHPKQGRKRKEYIFAALLPVLIFAGSWALALSVPPLELFLKGSEEWVRRNVDVDGIQTWLVSEEAERYFGQAYGKGSLDHLPRLVTHFEPKHVAFHGDDHENGRCVAFQWGGALNRWGFVVGLPTMKARQKGRFQRGGSVVEYRRQIRPGVYVYDAG